MFHLRVIEKTSANDVIVIVLLELSLSFVLCICPTKRFRDTPTHEQCLSVTE